MKVTEYFKNAGGKTLFTVEVLPPLKGENISTLFSNIDPLMEFKPPFIDVTYHREEYVFKQRGSGLLEKRMTRKRPGTIGICAAIQNRYKVDTVPHLICGGFSKEETEDALIDLHYIGIDNILALQGDGIRNEGRFKPEPNGHAFASELVSQIVDMNRGIYLDEELANAHPSSFCIGVAGYPEKHFGAPNLKTDLRYLKQKVDLGAEYIVTQMFFDNARFIAFVEECRAIGIHVPIIPGIKPITTVSQISVLPTVFHIDIPEDLAEAVAACKDNAAAKEVGIEWTIQQSRELMKYGVPCLHFYSMGKSDPIHRIARELF